MNYKYDDGGRSKSKRPKQKQDCVIRAIAIASGLSYDEMYDVLAASGRKCSRSTPKKIWQDWLNEHATRYSFPATKGCPRQNPVTFCSLFSVGNYVIQMAGHVSAVVDGVVRDVFRPREAGCIYAAWKFDNFLKTT